MLGLLGQIIAAQRALDPDLEFHVFQAGGSFHLTLPEVVNILIVGLSTAFFVLSVPQVRVVGFGGFLRRGRVVQAQI